MNCKKCGHALDGATVCPECGTSIGYVVNDSVGQSLGSDSNNSNGYVQNPAPSEFVQIENVPSGFLVSEPSDGAFNKNYETNAVNNSSLDSKQSSIVDKKTKSKKGFRPINKVASDVENATGAPTLVNFNTPTSDKDSLDESLLARAGTMSKEELLEQMNNTGVEDDTFKKKKRFSKGLMMELPDEKKSLRTWLIIAAVILVIIIVGVYILPLFTDINYTKYEDENFVIKYKKDWTYQVDKTTKKVNFLYRNTSDKIIINKISSFSEMNFRIETANDKKVLYKAFYDSWKNTSGGKLTGGSETFIDLKEDDSMYAKIDYVLDNNSGIGSFYVVVCEKYDLVIAFMTYCAEKDKEVFEEEVLEFINGIDYVGLTVQEKTQQEFLTFKEGKTKTYNAGELINYVMPEAWELDGIRTAAVSNEYNIFQFKDKFSLLEVKAYEGRYTYEGMKDSALSNYGALKSESQMTINGKVWYVLITPDYSSGGYNYHNELYFTISTGNKYIYFVQAYILNETSNDSVKRKYFDDSIKYILEKMTLNNVNQ